MWFLRTMACQTSSNHPHHDQPPGSGSLLQPVGFPTEAGGHCCLHDWHRLASGWWHPLLLRGMVTCKDWEQASQADEYTGVILSWKHAARQPIYSFWAWFWLVIRGQGANKQSMVSDSLKAGSVVIHQGMGDMSGPLMCIDQYVVWK